MVTVGVDVSSLQVDLKL